jgi:hypothetical protein
VGSSTSNLWSSDFSGRPLEPLIIGLEENQTEIDVTYELAEML